MEVLRWDSRLALAIIWVGNVRLFSFLSLAALELP